LTRAATGFGVAAGGGCCATTADVATTAAERVRIPWNFQLRIGCTDSPVEGG
jgi:hypothetical protein